MSGGDGGEDGIFRGWWARRPLAVIFSSLVDDPDAPTAPAQFVEACRLLPYGENAATNDTQVGDE